MLTSLHVKNMILIDEEEILFSDGLNILSGETGAGKSIILGALYLAMGDKPKAGIIRNPESDALVEAVFSIDDSLKAALSERFDLELPDNEVIMSRRISVNRSVAKINGEQVPSSMLKEVGACLLNIYGQSEYQTLSSKASQLSLLDEYADNDALLLEMKQAYGEYVKCKKAYDEATSSTKDRSSELGLLEYEINELTTANLKAGEDIELEAEFKRFSNVDKIKSALSDALLAVESASDGIGRNIFSIQGAASLDDSLSDIAASMADLDSLCSDVLHDLNSYVKNLDVDEERMVYVTDRVNELNRLKSKYGNSIENCLKSLDERIERKKILLDYDAFVEGLLDKMNMAKSTMETKASELRERRKKAAASFASAMSESLKDLNFLDARFDVAFAEAEHVKANGWDDIEFMIATNVGQSMSPVRTSASGGELSRIMLALKTVFAGSDGINTIFFDEIDAGISGRTATAVATKLKAISKASQIICITHLPQIAAKADAHFLIEKSVVDERTISGIKPLDSAESLREVARMLSGDTITEAALAAAKDLI